MSENAVTGSALNVFGDDQIGRIEVAQAIEFGAGKQFIELA
jgi:hypothetical protein